MVAYLCPLHASYFSTDYVNMQDTYLNSTSFMNKNNVIDCTVSLWY